MNKALTLAEVQTIYNEGEVYDYALNKSQLSVTAWWRFGDQSDFNGNRFKRMDDFTAQGYILDRTVTHTSGTGTPQGNWLQVYNNSPVSSVDYSVGYHSSDDLVKVKTIIKEKAAIDFPVQSDIIGVSAPTSGI